MTSVVETGRHGLRVRFGDTARHRPAGRMAAKGSLKKFDVHR
jgi:hypothetical protein